MRNLILQFQAKAKTIQFMKFIKIGHLKFYYVNFDNFVKI